MFEALCISAASGTLKPAAENSVSGNEGEKVLFDCRIVGTPTPNITWYRKSTNDNGKEVRERKKGI